MNRSNILKILAASLLGCSSTVVFAAPITYNVDQVVGAGSIMGTITTDGTLGALNVANFVGWNLTVTGPGAAPLSLTNANSVVYDYLSGECLGGAGQCTASADVSATAQALFFNFAGNDTGYWGFQMNGQQYSGQHYVCFATEKQGFDCAAGETVAPVAYNLPSFQQCNPNPPGNGVIGTVGAAFANLCGVTTNPNGGGGGGGGTSVPEPATLALLGLGLGAAALSRRSRRLTMRA